MSGTLLVKLDELRGEIERERERLNKRPVPTSPWAMPLGLDDLLAFVEVVERARDLARHLGQGGDADLRYHVARLDKALEAFS